MAYSIRQGSVVLTVQQFRDVVTVLEAIRDIGDDGDARAIASAALEHLKAEGLIAEQSYSYPPPSLPWERKPADETSIPLAATPAAA